MRPASARRRPRSRGGWGSRRRRSTAMIKKLAELGLVEHTPYKGATLTPQGERTALEVVRHHRLLEQYLAQTLGLSLDAVHAEADRLEHALSEELEAHIDSTLGYPTHDPHGDPIPDANLRIAEGEVRPLATLESGDEATIRRVPDERPRPPPLPQQATTDSGTACPRHRDRAVRRPADGRRRQVAPPDLARARRADRRRLAVSALLPGRRFGDPVDDRRVRVEPDVRPLGRIGLLERRRRRTPRTAHARRPDRAWSRARSSPPPSPSAA